MPIDKIGEPADRSVETKGPVPRPVDEGRLKKACTDFEAIFINQILRAMRQTVPHGGFLKEGPEMNLFQSLYDDKLSEHLARRKGMGLGEMIYRQMTRHGKVRPADSEASLPEALEKKPPVPSDQEK